MPRGGKCQDLTGKKYNHLTALRLIEVKPGKGAVWEFRCDCGALVELVGSSVKYGKPKSCGCMTHHYQHEITQAERAAVREAEDDIDTLKERYLAGDSTGKIGKDYGICSGTVRYLLNKHGLTLRNWIKKPAWYVGKRKGRRTVIGVEGNRLQVRCDCGNTQVITVACFKAPKSSSCGCLRKELLDKKTKPPYEEISHHYWLRLQRTARYSKRVFELTQEFLWDLYLRQNRRCSLSGLPIGFAEHVPSDPDSQTASLDRIDSRLGYTRENVQWVHKTVNNMKQNLGEEEFLEFCNRIAETHPRPRPD